MSDHNADRLLVQIASYNTALQGLQGLPQNLVDWLHPTFQVSNFLGSRNPRAPDIVAVGFQELLPLHLGLAGLSKGVIESRNALILSQIEAHAPNKERYSLVAKVVNVGVALLVYAKDDGISRYVQDVQTQWTGCGPAYMGNKGAVGVRFRVSTADGGLGEVFTFVNAHLTAHEPKLADRIADFHYIVSSLLFPPLPQSQTKSPTTIYSTSHLFFLGDLNFRVSLPSTNPLAANRAEYDAAVDSYAGREALKEFDQLLIERRKGTIFQSFREGEFWTFKCSYKFKMGEVDRYDTKRTPSWTDRILYTTFSDSPDTPEITAITNVLYTSIPSYTTSDHKPVVSLLLLPPPSTIPPEPDTVSVLRLPPGYAPKPDPLAVVKRYLGRSLDRVVGIAWWIFVVIGAGHTAIGIGNFLLGLGAWTWWKSKPANVVASGV
ncbi:inositol polyphosphate phosphatase [Auriscalpium vulgare]|uniref:Inositol polyphosphate phosphatase n=1 Tax=Auriscalpium vulgare TaxID=40419 RepID=A0ACB8SCT7_9AGAM|nr:inositol polyphosphate phosphatase [Auriscalpium vulgare]